MLTGCALTSSMPIALAQRNNSDIVYIKQDNSSKIYHKVRDIHNLKNTKGVTLFEAKKLRYKPCKKCFK